MRGIIEIIRSLDAGEGAKYEETIIALENRGINRHKAEESIEKLKQKISIFEPTFGRLKII